MHDVIRQPERRAQCAHLVLEEVVKRLDQIEMYAVGEGNQVVMALDGRGLAAGLARAALDDVGVDGALRQVLHRPAALGQLLRDGEELLPELRADDAALLLRLHDVGQQRGVAVLGVHVHEVHVELLREHVLNFFGLVLAQQPVVDEHAGQLLTDSLCAQRGHHGGVHAARKAQDHAIASHLLADGRHGIVDDGVHRPAGLKAADAEQEVPQQLVAVRRVAHLGMELRRVQPALRALHRGHGAHVGRGRHREARRRLGYGVAVAHPHRLLDGRLAVQQGRPLVAPRQRRGSVLALLGVAHGAAQRDGHNLLAVAEAQHGNAQLEDARIDGRRVLGVHAGRPARQDDGRGRELAHLLGGDVARDDFRVHVQIAHAAGDQLPVLGSEIDDDDQLAGRGGSHVCSFAYGRWHVGSAR